MRSEYLSGSGERALGSEHARDKGGEESKTELHGERDVVKNLSWKP